MVFVYHFLSSSQNHYLSYKSSLFLKDIEKGKYMGIVTTFTVAEYLAVTKGVLCNKRNGQVSASDMSKIKSQLEQFLSQMGIILYDSDMLASKNPIFSDCETIIENSGAFKGKYDRKWHHLRGADALHVALALSVKAEAIATFDDDFRGVSSINPIILSEVY